MIPWIFSVLALAAAPPAPAKAGWVVDWGDQRCSLIREAGGAKPLTLMVRTVPGAGQAELWLFDPAWRAGTFLSAREVKISLEPWGFRVTEYAVPVRFRGLNGIAVTNLDEGFLKNLPGTTAVRVERGGKRLARVPLRSSARAVASLRACEATVMRDWGFDPAVIQSLRHGPEAIGGAARWFAGNDYPGEAIRKRVAGSVLTRLIVGTDGRVAECVIVEGSGSDLLDQRTCELLVKRGRYEPAVTAAGTPTRAMSSVRIHWRLPGG